MLLDSDAARTAILRGARLMTRLLSTTLGPHGATVAAAPLGGQGRPQVLSRAGIIARRIVEVADPFENMGVLLVRHAAYTVENAIGDGVATTAVILESLLSGGTRLVVAGYPVPRLLVEIGAAQTYLLADLAARRLDLTDEEAAVPMVAQAIPEADLAETMCEAVLAVGESGYVEIRDGYASRSTVEFVEGLRSRGGLLTGGATDQLARVQQVGPAAVLVSTEPITDAAQVARLIEMVLGHGISGLLPVTPAVTGPVQQVIALANARTGLIRTLAVAPETTTATAETLRDLAAYSGAALRSPGFNDSLDQIRVEALGIVRRVWASGDEFAIIGPRQVAGALDRARQLRLAAASCDDTETMLALRRRIAALTGRTALLAVGGHTDVEREERRSRVEATIRAAQVAAGSGVIAGGGAALARAEVGPPTTGALLLHDAVAQPLLRIARRAGLEPGTLLRRTREDQHDSRFDVVARRWITGATPELVDPFAVVQRAVQAAVSAAVTALSSAVLVRSARPERSLTL